MKLGKILFLSSLLCMSECLWADGLDPAVLRGSLKDTWPSFNGDYSKRRYSELSQINAENVRSLGLAWTTRANTGETSGATIKATPLVVNGVLYYTVPNHAWAIDART